MVMDEPPFDSGPLGQLAVDNVPDDVPAIEANPDHEQVSRQFSQFLLRDIRRRQGRLPQHQRFPTQPAELPLEQLIPKTESCGLDEHSPLEDADQSGSGSAMDSESQPNEVENCEPAPNTCPGNATVDVAERVLPSTETQGSPSGIFELHSAAPSASLDAASSTSMQSVALIPSDTAPSHGLAFEAASNPDLTPRTTTTPPTLAAIEVDEDFNTDEGFADEGGAEPESDVSAALRFLARQRPWGTTRVRRSNDATTSSYTLNHNPPRMRRTKRKQKMRQRPQTPRPEPA